MSELNEFLDDVLLSRELLDSLLAAPIDEKFSKYVDEFEARLEKFSIKKSELNLSLNVKAVAELNQIYELCQQSVRKSIASSPLLLRLPLSPTSCSFPKIKSRLVEGLKAKAVLLARPNTNIQILQQSLLLKLAPMYDYLRRHYSHLANDVRAHYQTLLAQVFAIYFGEYLNVLNAVMVRSHTH